MVVNGFVIENLSQHWDLEANKKGRENKCGNDEGGEGCFRHFSHGANMTCPLFISAIRNSNSIRYKCSEMHAFQGYYFKNEKLIFLSTLAQTNLVSKAFEGSCGTFLYIYFFNMLVLLIVTTLRIIHNLVFSHRDKHSHVYFDTINPVIKYWYS